MTVLPCCIRTATLHACILQATSTASVAQHNGIETPKIAPVGKHVILLSCFGTYIRYVSHQWLHSIGWPYQHPVGVQAVVNEDAVGTNVMLKAELQRVKLQLAAVHGQTAALDNTLATSLAFDDQPNTAAAAQAAQVRSCCLLGYHPIPTSTTLNITDSLIQARPDCGLKLLCVELSVRQLLKLANSMRWTMWPGVLFA